MVLLIAIVILALAFDYTNGFHDTANAIATSVSTRALSPRVAVLMAAGLNLLGALVSTSVAKTVGEGIVNTDLVTLQVVMAALIGAVVWNLVTWHFGIPSSSSHALFGGLIGAMIASAGVSGVIWSGVVDKIILPMIGSPLLGFLGAWLLMTGLIWLVRKRQQGPVNRWFRRLQPISAGFMAFSHGANDAQKTMGIIALALFASGQIETFTIPLWVKIACALAMALGTYSGGWRIIHTLGSKVIKLDPIHGFAAETAAATRHPAGHPLRRPGLHHAHHHGRDHGRGLDAAPVRGALGSRRQHHHGVDPHAARRGPRRRRRLPRRRSDPGALLDADAAGEPRRRLPD